MTANNKREAEGAEKRFNEALKRMLKTPPKPHDDAKRADKTKPVRPMSPTQEPES